MTTTHRVPTALVLAILVVSGSACRGRDSNGAAAKPVADAAPPKPKLVRVAAAGEWLADVEKSKLSLAMVRDHDMASPVLATMVLHDGRLNLDANGAPAVRLSFDLNTFDSGIPMRNERVEKFFFESTVAGWGIAELVVAKLPEAALTALREKRRATHVPVDGELSLHGQKAAVHATVDAFYGPTGTLTVSSAGPFEVKVSDFKMTDNLKRLSSICLHESIEDIVKGELVVEFPAP